MKLITDAGPKKVHIFCLLFLIGRERGGEEEEKKKRVKKKICIDIYKFCN